MNTLYLRSAAMKAIFFSVMFFGLHTASFAQHILVVNDNNNITYNTDTVVNDLRHSIYSGFTYWSIPDSANVAPTAAYMANFDLVLWYCSTDGTGLSIWGTSTAGYTDLVTYAHTGKPLWIIGLDILYEKYTEGSTFSAGEMPKDLMGLTSYDVQSYVDDTSTGCPEVARISTASTLFPDTIKWEFSTLWYVDGCTPDAGTLSLYQMAPASYSLNGRKCMFHNLHPGISVMSTFFDPALIDSFDNKVKFLQNGITYLLGGPEKVNNIANANFVSLYPNPATSAVTLEIMAAKEGAASIALFNELGSKVSEQQVQLASGTNRITAPLAALSTGIYAVKVTDAQGNTIYLVS